VTVLLVTHDAMDAHASPGHPERPDRRLAALAGVRDGAEGAGVRLEQRIAEEADEPSLVAVHDSEYVALLAAAAERGGGWLDPDTYVGPDSVAAARLAAGATMEAARAVADAEAEVAFAAVRPPGHHARREGGSGFCLFNNVAVATEVLRRRLGSTRVAILDWDVHHGDGTQAIYEADPDVAYASTHQAPFYPGTGDAEERGRDAGAGTMHNRPLRAGDGDEAFVAAWRDVLLPEIERFQPDALLVSAGYDAHRDDPLAMLEVTERGYAAVAELVGALTVRLALPGVALTLEGGYDLAALRASIAATVGGILRGRRAGGGAPTSAAILDRG
jgi:acetoin utilization deacetylase AcuC-like enzyme